MTGGTPKGAGKPRPCPICGRPSEPGLTPFCSERCADIDLGRWLSDRYAIPAAEDPDDEAESTPRDLPPRS